MAAKYCTMAFLFLLPKQRLNYAKEVFVYCDLYMAAKVFLYCDLCMTAKVFGYGDLCNMTGIA